MLILTADEDVMDIAAFMFILYTAHVYSNKNHTGSACSHVSTCVLNLEVLLSLQCKALLPLSCL